MLKIFMLISTILIAFIALALLVQGTSFSQLILGPLYYIPIVILLNLGLTGVTTAGNCTLFGSCDATPFGWLLIALFWIMVILIISWIISFSIKQIKQARNID